MKYILITGGVISGIGKGVIASSIGKIMKSNGLEVTAIKIDPYLNVDAGTISPYEHGEVYVLDDGGEVDLDLGNYERFMDIKLHWDNNITGGKIYLDVINQERQGKKFLGRTVQPIPQITDAIQVWIERVSMKSVSNDGSEPEICIIELGGTIGDIANMIFVEAFNKFQVRVKRENFCCVHVSLIPQLKCTGEHKTKPTQESVRQLRSFGLSPDIIICRGELPINEGIKEKISNFCNISPEQDFRIKSRELFIFLGYIYIHDVKSVYYVPIIMEEQGLVKFFHERLNLPLKYPDGVTDYKRCSKELKTFIRKIATVTKEVRISLVGKYTSLEDAYASVGKALQHASLYCNSKLNLKFISASDLEPKMQQENGIRYHNAWETLCKSDGIIVPGGFGSTGTEGKICAIEWARKHNKPFLGICLGFQLAVVEFARNVLGWEDANSFEISQDKKMKNVVIEMPEHHTGMMGGTMRLGIKKTMFKTDDSITWQLYNRQDIIEERHRHRYEVDKAFLNDFERAGLKFVAEDETGERLEILELPISDHPYFVAVQFHPEFLSRPLKPSPPYLGLILASCGKLNSYLSNNCMSPTVLDSSNSESESPTKQFDYEEYNSKIQV